MAGPLQFFCSALLPPSLACEAYADACACATSAGLGGFVRLPDGRQCCFQHSLSAAALANLFPWFPPDANPQHFIASWELAAQVALLWCMQRMLGPSHLPVHCIFRTDNSASESACWKALSMARGMCVLLRTFFLLQRRFHISVHLDCVSMLLLTASVVAHLRLPWASLRTKCWTSPGHPSRLLHRFITSLKRRLCLPSCKLFPLPELMLFCGWFPCGSSSAQCTWTTNQPSACLASSR